MLEFARRLAARAPFASRILRQVAYVLLPTAAIWLILARAGRIAGRRLGRSDGRDSIRAHRPLPVAPGCSDFADGPGGRADACAKAAPRHPAHRPVAGRGSVVVSSIWKINLGSLLAAMGVGSIALAFALQEFLGNLLFGMALLSAHKFSIGDWIMVEGKAARSSRWIGAPLRW